MNHRRAQLTLIRVQPSRTCLSDVALRTEPERPSDQLRLVGRAARPENAILHKEQFDQLREAFGGLSQNHHRVLVLREFEGLSYREIAKKMDMTRPAVESALFRARRRLQQEYARAEAVA